MRNRGQHQNTILPTPEESTELARADSDFIERVCKMWMSDFDKDSHKKSCKRSNKKPIKQSMTVHKVGVQSGGNMNSFKFTFSGPDGEERYGRGHLDLDKKGRWKLQGTFGLVQRQK